MAMNRINGLNEAERGQSRPLLTDSQAFAELRENELVAMRWREAVEAHRDRLKTVSPTDYFSTFKFESPWELFENLRLKGQQNSHSWLRKYERIISILSAISTAVLMFRTTLHPIEVQTAVIFSILNLYMQLSHGTQQKWDDFIKKLDDTRQGLKTITIHQEWFQSHPSHEVSGALSEVFDHLLRFWTNAVVWIRVNETSNFDAESWKTIDTDFQEAMAKVAKASSYLEAVVMRDRYNEQQSQAHLEKFINIQWSSNTVQFPRKDLPSVAYRGFFGRQDIINDLTNTLRPDRSVFGLRSVLLQGMGGVGKTQTALAYAYGTTDFDAVFWVRSETIEDVQASFTGIAFDLKLPGRKPGGGGDEENFALVDQWFKAQEADRLGRTWLLIFDNCEDLQLIAKKYIPKTRGSVLITSRLPDTTLPDTQLVSMYPFSVQEGCMLLKQLLKSRTVSADDDIILQGLVGEVGGLPLGIRVLAAQMNDRINYSIPEFAKLFKDNPRRLLTKASRVNEYDRDDHRKIGEIHVLDNIWLLSFGNLESQNEDGFTLLGLLSLMGSEQIPLELFDCKTHMSTVDMELPSICKEKLDFEDATILLHKLGFLSSIATKEGISEDVGMLSIHRLIQDAFVYSRTPTELNAMFTTATTLLGLGFPLIPSSSGSYDRLRTQCNRVVPHVLSLARRYKQCLITYKSLTRPMDLGEIIWRSAWYMYENGNYISALEIVDIGINYCSAKGSSLYADLLNTHCCIYIECNDLQRARAAIEEAMIVRKRLVQDNVSNARSQLAAQLLNLGNVEVAEGNYKEAFSSFEEVITIRKELNSPPALNSILYLNFGRSHLLNGELTQGAEKFKIAEQLFLAEFSSKSTWIAFLNYQRGNLAMRIGERPKGRQLFLQARDIWRVQAPHHLALTACYFKLASLDCIDKAYQSALSDIDFGLAICRSQGALGDEARLLWLQAKVYKNMGQRDVSEDVKLRAWKIRRKLPLPESTLRDLSDESWDKLVCLYWR